MKTLKNVYHRLRNRYPALRMLRVDQAWFGNIVPLKTNLDYLRYQKQCRKQYSAPVLNGFSSKVREATDHFRKQGYVLLHPDYDPLLLKTILDRCEEMSKNGLTKVAEGEEWFINFNESMKNVPEIARLINDEVTAVVEACFESNFKIYSSEIYRIVPTSKPPSISGLWHTDNYPPGVYKIMVYLTPCNKKTGALGLHPRASTRRLLRAGFFDRFNAGRFQERLNQDGIQIEGPAGTVLFWNSNLIHRANPPLDGFRDVVAFKLLPSWEPWDEHFVRARDRVSYEQRNRQVPIDPSVD